MAKKLSKNQLRQRRHLRVRKHISGTPERPRLNVFRSLSNIYAQIIDDTTGNTLVSASTLEQTVKEKVAYGGNVEAAKEVGRLVAEKALAAGITTVVIPAANAFSATYTTEESRNLPMLLARRASTSKA